MKNSVMEVVAEMVNESAREIGVPVNDGNIEMVLAQLDETYGIILITEKVMTWRLMVLITDSIIQWEKETKNNFK